MGSVFISGHVSSADGFDAFVSKYDADGNFVWSHQPLGQDFGNAVTADGMGNVYSFGTTSGTNVGEDDAFLVKINDPTHIPEPSTLLLGVMACLGLLQRRNR